MLAGKFLLLALCLHVARSISDDDLYPSIGPDGQFSTLPRDNDDTSSSEIQLAVPIVFYGEIYKSLFVNSNGHISFLTEIPSFSNVKFPLRFPVIAPLYTDVDIRASGNIYYRETSEQNLLKRVQLEIQPNFKNYGNFVPKSLFIATWDKVGYFEKGVDKVNTFQVVIASNGTESFAQFMFPKNGIQWIQSDGKIPDYPDARAQSGFISKSGEFYELEDSGTDQVTNLELLSNTILPGNWIFHIGSPGITELKFPDDSVSSAKVESKSQAKVTCASAGRSECHISAKCNDYTEGFCCQCETGFYGDGKNCLKKNAPLRVNGKMNGLVNNIKIKDYDIHAYVVTKTGRTFTAISKAPSSLGHDMLSLSVIGNVIGWLFALPDPGAKNGYEITGGILNRSVEVEFPLTGDHIAIKQYILGLDAFGYLELKTDITGTTPAISEGTKINMRDYDVQYTKVKPGLIKTNSRYAYRIKDSGLETPFIVDETITYEQCSYGPKNEKLENLRMRTGRNYLIFDINEGIVRYAMTNRITLVNEVSPCRGVDCGIDSSCVADRNTYKCVCNQGFELIYAENASQGTCTDINECTNGRSNCHVNGECVNQRGSFNCHCKPGYRGDGLKCDKMRTCDDLNCNIDATCVVRENGEPECICKPGYNGDGYVCEKEEPENLCANLGCDENAECVYDRAKQQPICECKQGFYGDGTKCQKRSCEQLNCDANAACHFTQDGHPECICNAGYSGDGYVCQKDQEHIDCRRVNNCDVNADCVYNYEMNWAECKCKTGFTGDGLQCQASGISCGDITCDGNATCHLTRNGIPECICIDGFVGDGYICEKEEKHVDCRRVDNCDINADCVYNYEMNWAECQCKIGFTGDGLQCQASGRSCDNITCDGNATCHTMQNGIPECICNDGFVGNGYICEKEEEKHIDCRRVDNCDVNAACVYNYEMNWAECQCKTGFTGDGFQCQASARSCDNITCDGNATCHFMQNGIPECICNDGFVGNGYICEKEEKKVDCAQNNYCDINADCISNPATQKNECKCKAGYGGNGVICIQEQTTCQNCDINAACRRNSELTTYECVCETGYTGDGLQCTKHELACNVLNRCHAHGQCKYNMVLGGFECKCNEGYEGDGYQCTAVATACGECSPYAQCVNDIYAFGSVCRCNEGYAGDGYICQPLDECSSIDDCDFNAQCMFDDQSSRYVCLCNQGYVGDGKVCEVDPNAGCNILKDCHKDATCVDDSQNQIHICRCNPGFVGDGLDCSAEIKSCNVVNNCDINADCVNSPQGYRCQCKSGYRGNGFSCIATRTCAQEPRLCHSDADCILREDINQYFCQCRAGFKGDGSICRAVPRSNSEFLLFNQGMSILKIPIASGTQEKGELVVLEPLQTAVGMDIDCYNGYVYWTDVAQPQIKRARYNGSDIEVIVDEGLASPEGIAVDWVSGNIYWTDSMMDTIETMSIEGKYRRVLINDNLKNPRGIAVHPSREKLYWSDWHRKNPKIEYSNLDGTDRKLLVSAGLGLPNALAIDYTREELCWADAGEQRIECMGMRDGRRRTIASPIAYPFGLSTYEDVFYWTDWKEKFIHKLKRGETEVDKLQLPLGGNGKLYSLAVVPRQCPRGSNACAIQNGGCQFLCLPNGRGSRSCECPDDAKTSNSSKYTVCNEIN